MEFNAFYLGLLCQNKEQMNLRVSNVDSESRRGQGAVCFRSALSFSSDPLTLLVTAQDHTHLPAASGDNTAHLLSL